MIEKEKFHTLLAQGKMEEVKKLTDEALNNGESAEAILKEGFIQSMERGGDGEDAGVGGFSFRHGV